MRTGTGIGLSLPRVTKIDEQPLTLNTIRSLLSHGRPNKKMMALILTLVSSGTRLAEALSLRISDFELGDTPASVHIKAEYSKTRRDRRLFISADAKPSHLSACCEQFQLCLTHEIV